MYGFNEMKKNDITNAIDFIKTYKIKHVSWYALEVKENSLLSQNNYKLNDELIEEQLKLIIKCMSNINLRRYEVSSWSASKNYESIHNKSYWLTKDWRAIGFGGWGLENKVYYQNIGNAKKWYKQKQTYSTHDYYLHILLMGLRLVDGLDLKIRLYHDAYTYFKDKLKYVCIKNNHLVANNINLLNECLVNLI
jgi:oxygen-independent coproporphyrinogen-3 oxidase